MKGTKVKSSKGITLVALVITIIILLILAIVAINAVSGDGIIGKAKEAGKSYNEKAGEENTELARQLGLIENAINSGEGAGSGLTTETVTIAATTNGIAGRDATNKLVYYVPQGQSTAIVYGDKGDMDYSIAETAMGLMTGGNPTTTGNVTIAPEVIIEGNKYPVTRIGFGAFSGMVSCTGLTNVVIPNTITSIGMSAFSGCSNLDNITIPGGVTSIENSTFSGCTSLIHITIPNSVTRIENNAFSGCAGLTNIDFLPNSITNIGMYMFSNCTGLVNITIPSNITSIDTEAFSGCTNLVSVTIPNSVESMNDWIFMNCDKLEKIKILTTNENLFLGLDIFRTDGMQIYVLNDSIKAKVEEACTEGVTITVNTVTQEQMNNV